FENNIKKNFTDKLHLYKDQTLKIENGEQIKKNRYILKTSLLANNEHHDIIFKFYDDNGNWKIYDVDIAGISLIQTYRSQFLDILKYKNFATLIEKLKDGISIDAE
ncbi:MAG: ABC transporter substrate-binding protein, partial [Helicobacter sp.]|nr:ABC transporter substrate-binding protein [Helicobacter sp.]